MKMTASQQTDAMQFVMNKIRSKKPVPDMFQEIVNEFAFKGAAKYKSPVLREYQFDEHLQKPVEYDRLVTVLRRFLG
jgi:hypothetical protein